MACRGNVIYVMQELDWDKRRCFAVSRNVGYGQLEMLS